MNISTKRKLFLLCAFVFAVIISIYAYIEYNRVVPNTYSLKSDFRLDASELIKDFDENEQTANAKYSDKTISVRGVVSMIQSTDSSATVFLKGESAVASVICQFQKADKEKLANLKKGEEVVIKGVCSGYLMDVILVRCVPDK